MPISCEVVQKVGFGPPICRGGDRPTPDFGHAFSNGSYVQACGPFWLSSVQRPRRLGGEKEEKEEEDDDDDAHEHEHEQELRRKKESPVKQSVDILCRAAYIVYRPVRKSAESCHV